MKVRVELEELKAAIAEIECRTKDMHVSVEVDGRQIKLSAADKGDNMLEAVLYEDGSLGTQFRLTERLMFMKDKKRI